MNWKYVLGALAAVGVGVLVMGSKKGSTIPVPPTDPPDVDTRGKSGSQASAATWRARQTALNFVGAMTKCDIEVGPLDGVYGPKTKQAVRNFQVCAGIGSDGKWGSKTEAAMSKMLRDIAQGQVTIYGAKNGAYTQVAVYEIEGDHSIPHRDLSDSSKAELENLLSSGKNKSFVARLRNGQIGSYDSHGHEVRLSASQVRSLRKGHSVFVQSDVSKAGALTIIGPDHTHFLKLQATQ